MNQKAASNKEDFEARCEYFIGVLIGLLEFYEKSIPNEENIEILLIKLFDDKLGVEIIDVQFYRRDYIKS